MILFSIYILRSQFLFNMKLLIDLDLWKNYKKRILQSKIRLRFKYKTENPLINRIYKFHFTDEIENKPS